MPTMPTMNPRLSINRTPWLACALGCAFISTAGAASFTWDAGGGTSSWGTGTNWNPDGATFNNTTDLVFAGSGSQTYTGVGTAGGSRTIRSLTFTSAFGNSAGRIRYNSGGASASGNPNNLIFSSSTGTSNITLESGMTGSVDLGSAGSSVYGETRLTSNLVITNNSTVSTLAITSDITETSAGRTVTKAGGGLVVFSRSASYTGATTINNGTLRIGNGGTTGALSTSSAIAVNGSGILEIRRSNTVAQGVVFSGAPITGTGSFVQAGSGTTTLNAANSFSGSVTVNAGTLAGAGATNSPGVTVFGQRNNTRTITVNNGGTLSFNSGNILGANHVATTAPTLVINSGGTVTNAAPASNNALHNIEINGGTLTSTTGHQSGSDPFLPVYGAWNLNGTVTSTGESTISTTDPLRGSIMLKATGDKTTEFNVTSGTLTVSAPVIDNPTDSNIGSLSKSGSGTMILSGPVTYGGDTTVNAGVLRLANPNANNDSSTVTIAEAAATLDLTFATTDTVDKLFIGATQRAAGVYGAEGSEAPVIGIPQITGSGTLTVTTGPAGGYAAWSAANAGGQGPDLDFDKDGATNGIEFFLNATSGFTALPALDATNTITWTNGGNIPAAAYGTQFVIQTSGNLVDWTEVPAENLAANSDGPGGSLTYTLTGPAPRFVRLKVMPE
jgi:autotransporter-associated beta strand protein